LGVIAAGLLATSAVRAADFELRTTPRRTHTGETMGVGERFVCESDGLRRIDVAISPLEDNPNPFCGLWLYEGSRNGEPLRVSDARMPDAPTPNGYVTFEFEPIPNSRGKIFDFEVGRSSMDSDSPEPRWTAFVTYRGQAQDIRPWGDHAAHEEELEGTFVCEHPDMRALAIGIVAYEPDQGPASLQLWRANEQGAPLVHSELLPRASIKNGWAFFPMPVVQDSRWKTYRYRLRLPQGARASAGPNGLAMISYHGLGKVSPQLLGMSVGDEVLEDRDLDFRVFAGSGTTRTWQRLRERGGAYMAFALAAWIAASIGLLALVRAGLARGAS
jgi:hypothetical protein